MNEAIGETVSLGLVMFFIVIISSYLAFTINYSKAFKVKSKLIDIIQDYDNDMTNSKISEEMNSYIKEVGYSAGESYTKKNCTGVGDSETSYTAVPNQGWCYKIIETQEANSGSGSVEYKRRYVKVKTFVSIDIPIFNNIFPNIRYFTVYGSTKATYEKN